MSAWEMTETDAGKVLRSAILAGQSTQIAYLEFGTGRYTPTAAQTALVSPHSPPVRFTPGGSARGVRGSAVAATPGVYHVNWLDLLAEGYDIGEAGLFLTDPATNQPVLADVYSTPGSGPIAAKGVGSTGFGDILLILSNSAVPVTFTSPALASYNTSVLPVGTPTLNSHLAGEESETAGKPSKRFLVSDVLDLLTSPSSHSPGDVKATIRTTAESGWLMCDGASHLKTAYPALAPLCTEDPQNSLRFLAPDYRGRVLAGAHGQNTGPLGALNAVGETGGSADAVIAQHNHGMKHFHKASDFKSYNGNASGFMISTDTANTPDYQTDTTEDSDNRLYNTTISQITTENAIGGEPPTGSGLKHDTDNAGESATGKNVQPTAIVNWMVKT